MPTLAKFLGYYIYFWSNEPDEPIHVHVSKGPAHQNSTKIWVGNIIEIANNNDQIPAKDLSRIVRWLADNRELVVERWKEHFDL